jgi:hypothetical protein
MADDDILVEEDAGELVQWYDGRPLAVPVGVVTGSVIAAFAIGALVTVGVLALAGRLRD